jgi:hypothetical protein
MTAELGSNPVSPTDLLDNASITHAGICDKSQMPFLFSPHGSGGQCGTHIGVTSLTARCLAGGDTFRVRVSTHTIRPCSLLLGDRATIRWLSSLREVAIVPVPRDCSLHIPSRRTTHDNLKQLCRETADADLSGANSTPRRTSWLRPSQVEAGASTVRHELAQTGWISSCAFDNSDRTTGRILLG